MITLDDLRHGKLENLLAVAPEQLLDQCKRYFFIELRGLRQLKPSLVQVQHILERIELIRRAVEDDVQRREQRLDNRLQGVSQEVRHLQVPEPLVARHIDIQAQEWQPALGIRI